MKNRHGKQRATASVTMKNLHTDAEKCIQRKIWRGLFVTAVCMTLFVELVLCGIEAYIKNDVTLYVLDIILSYACDLLAPVTFFASCGFVGYSVLRYGISAYKAPVWFMVISVTLTQVCRIGLSYLMMASREREIFLSSWLPFAFANYILVIIEILCIFVVCVIVRNTAYTDPKNHRSAKNESKKQARLLDSPLRRVYFSLLLLISLFNLIPAIYTAIIDYLDLGFFKNLSEFLTFIKPFLQIIIFGAVGFFLMLFIGKRLCRYQNKLIRREHLDAESKQYEETIHVES